MGADSSSSCGGPWSLGNVCPIGLRRRSSVANAVGSPILNFLSLSGEAGPLRRRAARRRRDSARAARSEGRPAQPRQRGRPARGDRIRARPRRVARPNQRQIKGDGVIIRLNRTRMVDGRPLKG